MYSNIKYFILFIRIVTFYVYAGLDLKKYYKLPR